MGSCNVSLVDPEQHKWYSTIIAMLTALFRPRVVMSLLGLELQSRCLNKWEQVKTCVPLFSRHIWNCL